jgi:Tol biopolymer transport system component
VAIDHYARKRTDIYVVDSNGQHLNRITNGSRLYYAPDWRPAR